MKLSDKQSKELEMLSKPLIKWLSDNCNPHCKIDITNTSVELLEGVEGVHTNEFLKD